MQNYEKPEVILMTECSEGVYLADPKEREKSEFYPFV